MGREGPANAPRIAHQVCEEQSDGARGTSLIVVLRTWPDDIEYRGKGEARALIADPPGELHPHCGPRLNCAAQHRFGAARTDRHQENMPYQVANKVARCLLGLPSHAVCLRQCVLTDEVALLIVLVKNFHHALRVFFRRLAIPGEGEFSPGNDTQRRNRCHGPPELLDIHGIKWDSAADTRWQCIDGMGGVSRSPGATGAACPFAMLFDRHTIAGKNHIHSLQACTQRSARLFVAVHQGHTLWLQRGGVSCQLAAIGVRAQIVLGNVAEHLHRLSPDIQRVLFLFRQVQQPSPR